MTTRGWQRELRNDDLARAEASEINDTCPKCTGQGAVLGWLGNICHLRCIMCGWTFSREAK